MIDFLTMNSMLTDILLCRSIMWQMMGQIEMLPATTLPLAEKVSNSLVHQDAQVGYRVQSKYQSAHEGSLEGETPIAPSEIRVQTKTSLKYIEAGVAALNLKSTTTKLQDANGDESDATSSKTTFVVNFIWRFLSCRRGFRVTMSNNFDDFSFHTIRKRLDNSTIFKLCKSGDTIGVENLIAAGQASLYDVDSKGSSLLHVSIYSCTY